MTNPDHKWILGRRLVYCILAYLLASNAMVVYGAVFAGQDTETLRAVLENNTDLLSLTLSVVFGGKAIKEYLPRRK